MARERTIAVIGGGAAGCSAAWHLHETGHHVTLFEQEAAPGGRTHTWRSERFEINTGAGFFTNFYPLTWELIAETGLSRHIVNVDRATVLCDTTQRYPYQVSSAASFFRIPWLTLREKLRIIRLTVLLLLKKTRLDLVDPQRLAAFDDQSIADFARERLGENVYLHLIRPAIEPYWYFSCEEASAAMLLALHAEAPGAQFYTLQGGMDQLTTALTADVARRCETTVTKVRRSTTGSFELTTADGEQHSSFDGVVVATPAHTALDLVGDLPEADVSQYQREFLQSQRFAANVTVWYDVSTIDVDDCGFQLSPVGREWHGVAAWTDLAHVNREKDSGDRIAGVYLLDELSRRLLDEDDDMVAATAWQAVRHFQTSLPEEHPPVVRVVRRRHAIPIPSVGRYRKAATFLEQQQPPVVFAGDYLATATIEGALRSGQSAAFHFD